MTISKDAIEKRGSMEVLLPEKLPEDRRAPLAAPVIAELQNVTSLGDLMRFQVGVRLHPIHQYEISGGREPVKDANGVILRDDDGKQVWRDVKAISPSGSGYDYLNRIAGVDLITPEYVHDQNGDRQPNPIHRRDYVYLRMIAIWRNDVGQLTTYREDVEVDFQRLYEEARLNATWTDPTTWTHKETGEIVTERPDDARSGKWAYAKGAKHKASEIIEWKRNEDTGAPVLNEDGMPVYRLTLPNDVEKQCAQRLFDLRKFGLRYAYTVAKNRLLKVAMGVRTLPTDHKAPVVISIAGWRDLLSPQERERQAQSVSEGVWGAPIGDDVKPLSDDEMQTLGDEAIEGEYRDVEAVVADDQTPDDDPTLPDAPGGDNQTLGLSEE